MFMRLCALLPPTACWQLQSAWHAWPKGIARLKLQRSKLGTRALRITRGRCRLSHRVIVNLK
jgi:hypothetical protein